MMPPKSEKQYARKKVSMPSFFVNAAGGKRALTAFAKERKAGKIVFMPLNPAGGGVWMLRC
jgi:hypothetical protein